jgi:CTP:molybdopterin cytidylyltransferase MocA
MIAAVVLAAGASTRFGSPKQAVLLEPLLDRVRRSAEVGEVVVVLGAHELETGARAVRCPDWERGPGASLRCGLNALGDEVDAAVVVLADGPELDPQSIDRVVAAWRATGGERVGATYGGVRLHPLLLARSAWNDVPDEGLRALPAELVPCDDLHPPGDVDYAGDMMGQGWPPPSAE